MMVHILMLICSSISNVAINVDNDCDDGGQLEAATGGVTCSENPTQYSFSSKSNRQIVAQSNCLDMNRQIHSSYVRDYRVREFEC